MKNTNYISLSIIILSLVIGCTKDNLIYTGTANGNHDKTMWEYFKTDSYNWDSLRVMTKHANLQNIFEGTSSYGKNLTFFGITNHSIRRYLLQNGYQQVTDIPVDLCKDFILSSILNKKIKLDEFASGTAPSDPMQIIGKGGKMYTTLAGKELWIYTFRESYNEVPGTGPVKIYLVSPDTKMSTKVASSNIITQTGIVHSLSYDFTPSDF